MVIGEREREREGKGVKLRKNYASPIFLFPLMGDLVTAFPLPPRYYLAQGEGEGELVTRIRNMEPPPPPSRDLTCFGVVLKVGRGEDALFFPLAHSPTMVPSWM